MFVFLVKLCLGHYALNCTSLSFKKIINLPVVTQYHAVRVPNSSKTSMQSIGSAKTASKLIADFINWGQFGRGHSAATKDG
jgi:hypothetical protein